MRKRYKKRFLNDYSKWENEVIQRTSKIIKIEVQNQEINNKHKTVFYCADETQPEGRMYIIWERTTFNVGDEITSIGRIKDGVFLVWRYFYRPSEKLNIVKDTAK